MESKFAAIVWLEIGSNNFRQTRGEYPLSPKHCALAASLHATGLSLCQPQPDPCDIAPFILFFLQEIQVKERFLFRNTLAADAETPNGERNNKINNEK